MTYRVMQKVSHLPLVMNNVCVWNVRGINSSRKQQQVLRVLQMNNVAFYGLVEMKIRTKNYPTISQNLFSNWCVCTNFSCHKGGRILIALKPFIYEVNPAMMNEQVIHCHVKHIPSKNEWDCSVIYGFNHP